VKAVGLDEANLKECVQRAQQEHVVLTRKGKPIAMLVGVKGLDWEQLELGSSDEFWAMIRARRAERTISRAELDKRLGEP
jgi:prevent-host-death family protein